MLTMGGDSAATAAAATFDDAGTIDIDGTTITTLIGAINSAFVADSTNGDKEAYKITITNTGGELAEAVGTYAVYNLTGETFTDGDDFIVKLTGTSDVALAADFDVA